MLTRMRACAAICDVFGSAQTARIILLTVASGLCGARSLVVEGSKKTVGVTFVSINQMDT